MGDLDLENELANARAERDRLAEESRRHAAGTAIAAAFMARGIHGPAAVEVAEGLARSAELLPDGTPRMGGAVGAVAIAEAHLEGRGAFLLTTARARLERATDRPATAAGWDIQKATTDMAYDLEWKNADLASNKAAWEKFLAEKEKKLKRGDGRKWTAFH